MKANGVVKKQPRYSCEETRCLLELYCSEYYVKAFEMNERNHHRVFEELSNEMRKYGYVRSVSSIRHRIKNLRYSLSCIKNVYKHNNNTDLNLNTDVLKSLPCYKRDGMIFDDIECDNHLLALDVDTKPNFSIDVDGENKNLYSSITSSDVNNVKRHYGNNKNQVGNQMERKKTSSAVEKFPLGKKRKLDQLLCNNFTTGYTAPPAFNSNSFTSTVTSPSSIDMTTATMTTMHRNNNEKTFNVDTPMSIRIKNSFSLKNSQNGLNNDYIKTTNDNKRDHLQFNLSPTANIPLNIVDLNNKYNNVHSRSYEHSGNNLINFNLKNINETHKMFENISRLNNSNTPIPCYNVLNCSKSNDTQSNFENNPFHINFPEIDTSISDTFYKMYYTLLTEIYKMHYVQYLTIDHTFNNIFKHFIVSEKYNNKDHINDHSNKNNDNTNN